MKKHSFTLTVVLIFCINILGQDTAQVSVPFEIYDNAGGQKTMHFGVDLTATDSIDIHLGESDLPPIPPSGVFDVRWILPKNNFSGDLSSYLDYRYGGALPMTDTVEYRVKYQATAGADTMFFRWNFPPEITARLQDLITGTLVNVFMSDSGEFSLTNFAVLTQMRVIVYYSIIPVELTSFAANLVDNKVHLNWTTATELNNQGFEIERRRIFSEEVCDWENIGFVPGFGTTSEPRYYSFKDDNVAAGTYYYRLKQMDYDGSFEYSNIVEATISVPQEFVLEQNYPNPFNPSTEVHFTVPNTSEVTITIYDMLGKEVRTLFSGQVQKGTYSANWDGTNNRGQKMSSGSYMYRMISGDFVQSKKMILIK